MSDLEWPEPHGLSDDDLRAVLVGVEASCAAWDQMAPIDRPNHYLAALEFAKLAAVRGFLLDRGIGVVFSDVEPDDFA